MVFGNYSTVEFSGSNNQIDGKYRMNSYRSICELTKEHVRDTSHITLLPVLIYKNTSFVFRSWQDINTVLIPAPNNPGIEAQT